MKLRNTLFVILLIFVSKVYAQNPLITHRFSADPTARVMNDTLFVFPSSDTTCTQIKGNNGFCMPDYHVYSTTDLTTWTDHGEILSHNTVPWVVKDSYGMWAPDCIEKEGKYYFYFPAMPKDGSAFRRIGVAVADTPTGPYTPENHYIEGIEGIDPNVFIDDDGSVFLYYGGGEKLFWVELNQDMKTIKTKPQKVEGLPPKYKEGPFVFKRKDKYYFTFPHAPSRSEEIAYAIGDSPRGPFKYQGKVLEGWKDGCWTNHHSFVEYKNEWLLFYHHMDISGNKHRRSMCADRIQFDENGLIPEIKATQRGIAKLYAKDPIQVDKYSEVKDVSISKTDELTPNWIVKNISEQSMIKINDIDFEKYKYPYVALWVSSTQKASIDITINNSMFAQFKVPAMKEGEWRLIKTAVLFQPEGLQNLTFNFEGNTENLQLDWIQCISKKNVLINKTVDIELEDKFNHSIEVTSNKGKLFNTKVFNKLKIREVNNGNTKGHLHVNGDTYEVLPKLKHGDVISFTSEKANKVYDAFSNIQAINCSDQQGTLSEPCKLGGKNVGYIDNGDYLVFSNLQFSESPKSITIGIATPKEGGIIEIRKNQIDGELISSLTIPNTGGWQKWSSITKNIDTNINQRTKIYIVFKGSNGFLMNIKDLKFNRIAL